MAAWGTSEWISVGAVASSVVIGCGSWVHASRTARRTLSLQRRSEVYLALLEIVHRRGERMQVYVAGVREREGHAGTSEWREYYGIYRQRPYEEPHPGDPVRALALLTLSSDVIKVHYESWLRAVEQSEDAKDVAEHNWMQNGDPDDTFELKDLSRLEAACATEECLRKQLGERIKSELAAG